jgi:hypothetical protein
MFDNDFFSENPAVYEITWKNTEDNIIWDMRFECWINKATNTHSEYNTYCSSRATVDTLERASKLR